MESGSLLNYGWEVEEQPEVRVKQPRQVKPQDREAKAQKRITDTFLGSGILLSGQAVSVIKERGIDPKRIIGLAREKGVYLVTKEFIQEFFPEEKKGDEYSFVVRKGKPAAASQIEAQLVLDKDKDVTGNSTSEGTVENFVELFRDRYKRLKSVLNNRVNLKDTVDLENTERYRDQEVKVIGMIREMRTSRNGNLIIEIEDPTGSAIVIDSSEAAQKNRVLVNDEVIGVVGTVKGDLILAKEVIEPDIPMTRPQPECEDPISMAFISDVHVGSLLFKDREFQRFLDWLNLSSGNRKEVAQSIKYLFIAGDLVDGVGIYPNQENELAIPDIYKQYDYFAKLMEQVPSYIEVIIAAGNHDAVRRAEPQPSLADFLDGLEDQPNIHLVGNPARVKAHGVDVLMYHGTSMDAMISALSHLSYDKPEKAQVEYLKKRHLSPIYGTKEQIAPEEKDYMAIDFVPDVFHCGHVHKNGYANYRGVKVINSGTWQAQTDFQQQQGHMPTPCQVPILDLQSNQLRVINFGGAQ